MERNKIEMEVNDILLSLFDIDYSEIKNDAVLADDFGADSLDELEIIMKLEQKFGIIVPDEKMYHSMSKGCSVKDIYDLVEELL
ncbi:MAG: acyl carrier protein [Bacteroidaceae bacterium]|nr:acyl carrier protein [Bacteroidaceae bacterium]